MEMPTTLFIADVPARINEADFAALFEGLEGFRDARLRKDRNSKVVGFADFEDGLSAAHAMEILQGHKWSTSDEKGLAIQYSHSPSVEPRSNSSSSSNNKQPKDFQETAKRRRDGLHSPLSASTEALPISNGNGTLKPTSPMPHPSLVPDLSMHANLGYHLPALFPSLPDIASSTLYLEGLPSDATEREVAHIFRPFPGYQSLRILTKEAAKRTYTLCFVEFDNKYQATFALNHLQGYRMDKNDTKGITVTYAKTERKPRKNPPSDVRKKI